MIEVNKMIDNQDILSLFYTNICSRFSGCCSSGKCFLVKKHKEKLDADGDFSITLNERAQQKHIQFISNSESCADSNQRKESEKWSSFLLEALGDEAQDPEKVTQRLLEHSNKWPLKIAKCFLHHGRLHIYLHRPFTFQTLLCHILFQGPFYWKSQNNTQDILLSIDSCMDDELMMNMTEYRVFLVRNVLKNLLSEFGHVVTEKVGHQQPCGREMHFHLSSKSATLDFFSGVLIHCGTVIDIHKKCKANVVITQDYLRQKCEEFKIMSRHKHGEQVDNNASWDQFFKKIGEAALRIDLLSVRPSRPVTLNFKQDCPNSARNASFILYNCARLAALRELFEKKCSENIYPPIVPFDEIDFSLLLKEEEWELLSCYLLVYPHVLRSTIEHLNEGKPTPNLLCHFLYSLCSHYSSYYRRVRILTEPRAHLLPVMFARLYLLQAVECILHSGLRLLGVEPIRYM